MTINLSDNSPRISYSVGQGVTQTTFAVPFEFFAEQSLNVYVDSVLKTLTTHYTTTGGDGSTGTVVISVTGASGGSTVVITREIDLERTADFPTSGPFQISALNTELDRIIAIAADVQDKSIRSIRAADSDSAASYTLPFLDDRKGTVLAFNATSGDVEVGPQIANVQSLANVSADIALLADIQDGTTATGAITNVNTIRTDVTTVSGISANVTTVAGNNANVTTVAGISANVTTVAGDSSDIQALGPISSNITTVAGISSNVTTVAGDSADIQALAAKTTEIGLLGVADVISDMNTLATSAIITDMDALADLATEIDALGDVSAEVTAVAAITSDVVTVSGISANVSTVAGANANITTVAGANSNITTIASDLTSGSFVAGSEYDFGSITNATSGTSGSPDGFIVTVFNNLDDITSVAGISSDVTTVASMSSSNLTTVAGISSDVSTVAGISSNVTSVAGISANVTSVAGITSDVTAVAGISADVSTVASNVSGINDFAERYRVGSSEPSTSLDVGDLFYNTSSTTLKIYNGSAWEAGVTAGSGFLAQASNLSDLQSAASARTNLGLGTAATSATGDFAAAAHNHDADYAALSHTHVLANITDSGTMASQNANNVNITGGVIDGGSIV